MAQSPLQPQSTIFESKRFDDFQNIILQQREEDIPFTYGEVFTSSPKVKNRFAELEYLVDIKNNPEEYSQDVRDQANEYVAGYDSSSFGIGPTGVAEEYNQLQAGLGRYRIDREAQARAAGPPAPREYLTRIDPKLGTREIPLDDPRLDNVEDLQELESLGIYQGDQYYDAPNDFSEFMEKYTGAAPKDYLSGLITGGLVGADGKATYDSPWRIKQAYYPIDLTPREAKSLVENEDPNAEFRYIDPRDPFRGLAIRSEKTNNVFVPFKPQFGEESIADALFTGISQEMTPILVEALGLKLTKDIKDLGFKGSIKGGAKDLGLATGAAALGRYSQLLYGKLAGINPDLDPYRALEDAGIASLYAAGGVFGANILLGLTNGITQAITGEFLPPSIIARLKDAADRIKTPKRKPEFSEEELNTAVKEAGLEVGETLNDFQRTTGEILQDDYFLQLEKELYGYLNDTSEGRAAFDALYENQSDSLRTFWRSLSQEDPDLPDNVTFESFKKYIEQSREESLRLAKEAAERATKDLEEEISFGEAIAEETLETTAELAAPILGKVGRREDSLYPRDTPELTMAKSERYKELKDEYETALDRYDNVRYPKASVKNVRFIKEPFRQLLEGKKDPGQILRSLEDAEAAQIAREIAPMTGEGVSTIQQLLGVQFIKDADGKDRIAPKADWSLKDYAVAREVAHSLSVSHSNASVRDSMSALVNGFDLQIKDLLREGAKQRLREEIPALANTKSIDANLVNKWMLDNEWGDDITNTFTALREEGAGIDAAWLRDLTKKRPEEIAEYVFSSNPTNVENLMKELMKQPDSTTKIRAIRQLVLNEIDAKVGKGTAPEQAKNWKAFKDKYEMQLASIFDEDTFIKLANWEKAQAKAIQDMDKIAEDMLQLEKEYDGNVVNVIGRFIESGAATKRNGETADLNDFRDLMKKYPSLQPYARELFKKQLRSKFGDQMLEQGRGMLDGGFLVKAMNALVSDPVEPGKKGTKDLGLMMSKLLGPEVGPRYAKSLRQFNVLLQQAADRNMKGPLKGSGGGEGRLENQLTKTQTLRTIMRALIAPLSALGRKLNLGSEKIGMNSLDNLLSIIVDPSKIDQLMRVQNAKLTTASWIKFMGALAMSRTVDIGSELNRTEREKVVDDMIEEYQIQEDYFTSKHPILKTVIGE